MQTQPGFQPPQVSGRYVYLLRAQDLDGKTINPITCSTEQEVEAKIEGLTSLGYLNPRVTITKRPRVTK